MSFIVLGHIGFVITSCRNFNCCNSNEECDRNKDGCFPVLGSVGEGKIVLRNHGSCAKTKLLLTTGLGFKWEFLELGPYAACRELP